MTAHGWPVADPKRVDRHQQEWVELLGRLPSLREAQLVEVERLSHGAGTGDHVYLWADLDEPLVTGITRTAVTLPDLFTATDTDGDQVELRRVFVRDRTQPGNPPLGLLPFAGITRCPGCGIARLFLYARHDSQDEGNPIITLRCMEKCGTLFSGHGT